MVQIKIASIVSAIMLCLFVKAEQAVSKRLTDWFEAEWFSGLVKIPLTIDDSALWYANVAPCQNNDCSDTISGGKCLIDNNNPYTILYANGKTGETQTWENYDFDACGSTENLYWNDGGKFRGYWC